MGFVSDAMRLLGWSDTIENKPENQNEPVSFLEGIKTESLRLLKDFTDHPIVQAEVQNVRQLAFPLLCVWAANQLEKYQNDPENPMFGSLTTTLVIGATLIQTGLLVYDRYAGINVGLKQLVESSFSYGTHLQPKTSEEEKKEIAIQKHCDKNCHGFSNRLNSNLYRNLHYFSNHWAISRIPDLPVLIPAKWALGILANGSYIYRQSSSYCRKHERQRFEYTSALGLMYTGFDFALKWLLLTKIGVPASSWSLYSILQLPFFLATTIAIRIRPPVTSRTGFLSYNPLDMLESFVEFNFEALLIGYPAKFKELLAGPKSDIDWKTIQKNVWVFLENPYTKKIKQWILPDILHDWEQFIHAPSIKPVWVDTRKSLMFYLDKMIQVGNSRALRIAQYKPKSAAKILSILFGINPGVAAKVIKALGQKAFREKLLWLYQWLTVHGAHQDSGFSKMMFEHTLCLTATNHNTSQIDVPRINWEDRLKQLTLPDNPNLGFAAIASTSIEPAESLDDEKEVKPIPEIEHKRESFTGIRLSGVEQAPKSEASPGVESKPPADSTVKKTSITEHHLFKPGDMNRGTVNWNEIMGNLGAFGSR